MADKSVLIKPWSPISKLNDTPRGAMTVPSKVKVTQSCLILYNHMDCSLPGSSVHEILQARIMGWVAISFSSNSSKTLSKDQGVHSGPIPAYLHRFPKMGFPGGSDNKESTCNAGDLGWIPGLGRAPGEGTATHSSILAWRIACIEEPGRLHTVQRIEHDWTT